jgi:hypothetical protein
LIQHRYELSHQSTQLRNKLTAICDELFPEFTQIFRDPNREWALAYREKFPTPQALAAASIAMLQEVRARNFPSDAQLLKLQQFARETIGTKDRERTNFALDPTDWADPGSHHHRHRGQYRQF